MGNFRTGADAAQEASKGGTFAKTHYLSLKDGETVLVRFLTDKDNWIVVDQHSMVPTKGKPSDWAKDTPWPEKMGAVCRRDPGVKEMTGGDCFICDHLIGTGNPPVKKPTPRVWALAVLREEVMENGTVVGVKDQTREVVVTDKDGKVTDQKREEKAVVVVNMGFKNFFSVLQGFGSHYGTTVDRDYFIKRVGSEMDTQYQIIPSLPITLQDGTVFDLRNPKFADRYPLTQTLEQIVVERASDDFFARFFDTRVQAPASRVSGEHPVPPQDAPEAQGSELSRDELAALVERVKGHPGKNEPDPAPVATTGGMRDLG